MILLATNPSYCLCILSHRMSSSEMQSSSDLLYTAIFQQIQDCGVCIVCSILNGVNVIVKSCSIPTGYHFVDSSRGQIHPRKCWSDFHSILREHKTVLLCDYHNVFTHNPMEILRIFRWDSMSRNFVILLYERWTTRRILICGISMHSLLRRLILSTYCSGSR